MSSQSVTVKPDRMSAHLLCICAFLSAQMHSYRVIIISWSTRNDLAGQGLSMSGLSWIPGWCLELSEENGNMGVFGANFDDLRIYPE